MLASDKMLAGEEVARATARPSRPLSERQVFEKFADCLGAGGAGNAAEVVYGRLKRLKAMPARALAA